LLGQKKGVLEEEFLISHIEAAFSKYIKDY
jgi:hypothetical protein